MQDVVEHAHGNIPTRVPMFFGNSRKYSEEEMKEREKKRQRILDKVRTRYDKAFESLLFAHDRMVKHGLMERSQLYILTKSELHEEKYLKRDASAGPAPTCREYAPSWSYGETQDEWIRRTIDEGEQFRWERDNPLE